MTERPILFSGPMVRALLTGTKTQTRRVVKPQPVGGDSIFHPWNDGFTVGRLRDSENAVRPLPCPYGGHGHRLWVKETFLLRAKGLHAVYRADMDEVEAAGFGAMYGGWRPSIFMPRVWSRLTLEIVRIRAERLHEITEADAEAEGADKMKDRTPTARDAYRYIWEAINGRESWAGNPWVWVVEFKRANPESSGCLLSDDRLT